MSCPVDHSKLKPQPEQVDQGAHGCPVKHDGQASQPPAAAGLDTSRVTSSIPRASGGNWEYPSEAQFFAAMARKNHNPQASDMSAVVPIHNAVNERAWFHVLDWETGRGGEACGGIKLVTFKGLPNQLSLRARWKTLWGYQAPFDRHDWVVDRCGVKMRYIIDFYTGKGSSNPMSPNMSFYLDCRPALDNWEGVKMRTSRFWSRIFGLSSTPAAPVPHVRPVSDSKSQ